MDWMEQIRAYQPLIQAGSDRSKTDVGGYAAVWFQDTLSRFGNRTYDLLRICFGCIDGMGFDGAA